MTIYHRVIPEHFSKSSDDLLMRSLIKNFSIEGNTNGKGNGEFYITKEACFDVAKEVVSTHHGFGTYKTKDYLDEHFEKLWKHHDVLNEGFLDVAKAPVLLRSLIGEVESFIGLQ